MIRTGRHFLQIPGPTNVPDRVLRAMDRPVIDHRGPEFAALAIDVLTRIRDVFGTAGVVVIYPSSGSGACEAALVNTLSPGDHILICENGWFSHAPWRRVAERLGLHVEMLAGNWRAAVSGSDLQARLARDTDHAIKAVVVVHNETSTGATSDITQIRAAIDGAGHPTLLLVDAISSLGSIPCRHDDWEADVTVSGSQKGLMLPPGLGFAAISQKAIDTSRRATLPRAYFDWQDMLASSRTGFFPYTPATPLLFGLREALDMLREEGLPNVFARHVRHGRATRAAVTAWGLDVVCQEASACSSVITAVLVPDGHDADALRATILEAFDMSLGTGLGKLAGRCFRIGHVGSFNDLMLAGTLCGIEMGLRLAGIPHRPGGVQAAFDELTAVSMPAAARVP